MINGAGQEKEYNYEGELLYEGDYLNGQRYNGKGIEYDDKGELLYKGEYQKGTKSKGYGKKYNLNRFFIYEGEIVNELSNGKGIACNIDENIKFEGVFKDDKILKGKMYEKIESLNDKKIIIKKNKIKKKKIKIGN